MPLSQLQRHNQQRRQIKVTYNQELFLLTNPYHRQKGLFPDEKKIDETLQNFINKHTIDL
jgi:hypothetical protein